MTRHIASILVAFALILAAFQAHAAPVTTPRTALTASMIHHAVLRGSATERADIVLAKGKGKPRLKPIFEREAKPRPKAAKPEAKLKRPIGVSGAVRGKSLERRVGSVRSPNKRVSVSGLGHLRFTNKLRDTGRRLARQPLTAARIETVRASLRTLSNERLKYELKFEKNDLIYGIQSRNGEVGSLKAFRDRGGGGTLVSSMSKPVEKSWAAFTKDVLASAARSGQQVHFNLTGMKDVEGALKGRGKNSDLRVYNGVTAQELRYIRDNWTSFKVKPKFYLRDIEVKPPWLH